MTYEELIDFLTWAKFHKYNTIVTEEEIEATKAAIKEGRDYIGDVNKKVEQLEKAAKYHRENNTPEYQEAKEKYDKAVIMYAAHVVYEPYNTIPKPIEELLANIDLYGVDNDFSTLNEDTKKFYLQNKEYLQERMNTLYPNKIDAKLIWSGRSTTEEYEKFHADQNDFMQIILEEYLQKQNKQKNR